MRPDVSRYGVSVVFPCLDEEKSLPKVLQGAAAALAQCAMPSEIIVADNGSQDFSVAVAVQNGARVVQAPLRGYGAALHAGISSAKYDFIVFADADGSYPMHAIPDLLEPLKEGKADLVLGSRLRGTIENRAMPFLNRFLATPILSWWVRALYGLPVSDCNSGMRAISSQAYGRLDLKCPGMEYASEMLVKAALHRLRYGEIPIDFYRDQRKGPSHLKRWRDGWRHLRVLLAYVTARKVRG